MSSIKILNMLLIALLISSCNKTLAKPIFSVKPLSDRRSGDLESQYDYSFTDVKLLINYINKAQYDDPVLSQTRKLSTPMAGVLIPDGPVIKAADVFNPKSYSGENTIKAGLIPQAITDANYGFIYEDFEPIDDSLDKIIKFSY
jgi:hypothetical protein